MNFKISLAGVNIEINSIYDEIYNLCRDYYTDKTADFTVSATPQDVDYERDKSALEAKLEGRPVFDFTSAYLETLAVYRKIAEKMLDYDAFLMHGAAVAVGGAAYLFTAPSGVGKTTHTRFWLQTFPDAFMVNGDKPLIRFIDKKAFVCGTPWAGKEGYHRNVIMPLKAVCTLFRGKENSISRANWGEVFPLVIGQVYRSADEIKLNKTLQLVKNLGERTRFYTLYCNLNPNAARVAKNGIDKDD